jgi:hypothetical protein
MNVEIIVFNLESYSLESSSKAELSRLFQSSAPLLNPDFPKARYVKF